VIDIDKKREITKGLKGVEGSVKRRIWKKRPNDRVVL
jgi:hypothetical protein